MKSWEEQHRERLEAVRASFRAMTEFERHTRRIDYTIVFVCVLALAVMSYLTMDGLLEAIVLGLGFGFGGMVGSTLTFRRLRDRDYARLKDAYHEIELQNMITEVEEEE